MDNHEEHDEANRLDIDSKSKFQQDSSGGSEDRSSSLLHSTTDSSVEDLDHYAYYPDGNQNDRKHSGVLLNGKTVPSNEDSGNDEDSCLTSAENEEHQGLGFHNLLHETQKSNNCQELVEFHVNKLLAGEATLAKTKLELYKSTVKHFGLFFSAVEVTGNRLSDIPSLPCDLNCSSALADVSSSGSATLSSPRPFFAPSRDGEDPFTASAPHSLSSTPLRPQKSGLFTRTASLPASSLTDLNSNCALKDLPEASRLVKLVMESRNEYQKLLDETIGYCEKAQKNMFKLKESQKLKDESAVHEMALKINEFEQKHLNEMHALRQQHGTDTSKLKAEVARLERAVAEKTLKSEELFVLNRDLCKDFEIIKAKRMESESCSLVLGEKLDELRTEILEMSTENIFLKHQLDQMNLECDQLTARVQESSTLSRKLEEELQSRREEMIEMYAENTSLKSQMGQLDVKFEHLTARDQESRTLSLKLEEELERLRKEREEWLAGVNRAKLEHTVDEKEVAQQEQQQLTAMRCELERLLQQREDESTAADTERFEVAAKNKEEVSRLAVMLETEKQRHREAQLEADALTDELDRVKEGLRVARTEAAKYKDSFIKMEEVLAEEVKARDEERLEFTAVEEKFAELESQLFLANKNLQNVRLHLENSKESVAKLEKVSATESMAMVKVQHELQCIKDCLKQILAGKVSVMEGFWITMPCSEGQIALSADITDLLEKIYCKILSNQEGLEKANGEVAKYSAELKEERVELDKCETTVRELEDNRAVQKEALQAIQENVAMTLETLVTLRQDRQQELTALNEVAMKIAADCKGSPTAVGESSKLRRLFDELQQKQTSVRKNMSRLECLLRSLIDNSVPKFDESICGKNKSLSGASILEEQDSIMEEDLPSSQSPVRGVRRPTDSKCTQQPEDALLKTLRKVFSVKRFVQHNCIAQTKKIAHFRASKAQLKKETGTLEKAVTQSQAKATLLQEQLNERQCQLAQVSDRFEKLSFEICERLSDPTSNREAMQINPERLSEINEVTLSLKTLQARFTDAFKIDDQGRVRLDILLRCSFLAIASYAADQKELLSLRNELAETQQTIDELQAKHSQLELDHSSVNHDNRILHNLVTTLSRELEGCKAEFECVQNVGSEVISSKTFQVKFLAFVENYISQMQNSLSLVKSKVDESSKAIVSLEGRRAELVRAATYFQEEFVQAKAEVKQLERALKDLEGERALSQCEHNEQVARSSKVVEEKRQQMTALGESIKQAQELWGQKELEFVKTIGQLQDEFATFQEDSSVEQGALRAKLEEERNLRDLLSTTLKELQEKLEQQVDTFNQQNIHQVEMAKQMDDEIKLKGNEIRKKIEEIRAKDILIDEMKEGTRHKCEEVRVAVLSIRQRDEEIQQMGKEILSRDSDIREKVENLRQKDVEIRVYKEEIREKCEEFNLKCDLLSEENEKCKGIVEEMTAHSTSLTLKNEELIELNSTLRKTLQQRNEEIENTTEQLMAKKNEITVRQNTIEELRLIIKENEDKLALDANELDCVRADMLTLKESHERTLEERDDLLTLLEETREKGRISDAEVDEWKVLAQMQERRTEAMEALNNTVRDLEQKNEALAASLAKKQHTLDKVNKHHSMYKRDMAALKERFGQAQRDLEAGDKEVGSCHQRIDHLSAEVKRLNRAAHLSSADEAEQRRQCELALAQVQLMHEKCSQLQEKLSKLQAARSAAAVPQDNISSQGSSDVVPDSQPEMEARAVDSARDAGVTRLGESAAKGDSGSRRRLATSQSGVVAVTRLAISLHPKTNVRTPSKFSANSHTDESRHDSLNDTSFHSLNRLTNMERELIPSNSRLPTNNTVDVTSVCHVRTLPRPAPPSVDCFNNSLTFAVPCLPAAFGEKKRLEGSSAVHKRSLAVADGNNKRPRRAPAEVAASSLVPASAAVCDHNEVALRRVPVWMPWSDDPSCIQPRRQQPPHRSTHPSASLRRVVLPEALHTAHAEVALHPSLLPLAETRHCNPAGAAVLLQLTPADKSGQ